MASLPARPSGHQQPSLPPKPCFAGFMARLRGCDKQQLAPPAEEPPTNAKGYSAGDFEFMQDRLNAGLDGSTKVGCQDSRLRRDDSKMRVVDMKSWDNHWCAPLVCPALLHDTLSKLPQPFNLKLSTDGTYRVLLGNVVLITMGVNVKRWGVGRPERLWAFRSTFLPLAFALADAESEHSYSHLTEVMFAVAQHLGNEVGPGDILQWHGDMHKGIEAARQSVAPSSTRLADLAHVLGVTSEGPAGLPGLAEKKLGQGADSSLLPLILQWCRLTRYMTKFCFSVLWKCLFKHLALAGHEEVCTSLQEHYFHSTGAAGDSPMWDAPWRAAPDRIMLGTSAGSAPQEAWHRADLKNAVTTRSQTPYGLAAQLQDKVIPTAFERLVAFGDGRIADWPSVGKFIDPCVMKSDTVLNRLGRTCAESLADLGCTRRYEQDGNILLMIPTSTLKKDFAKSTASVNVWKDRTIVELEDGAEALFYAMFTAEAEVHVREALEALGVYSPVTKQVTNWKLAARLFDDWRFVALGPLVSQHWEQHRVSLPADVQRNKHMHTLCFLCDVAAKWGPCEHQYAAMMNEGLDSAFQLPEPRKKGRPPKTAVQAHRTSEPGARLSPGPRVQVGQACAAASASSAPSSSQPCGVSAISAQPSDMSETDKELQLMLKRSGRGHLFRALQKQHVTVEMLRELTYSDFQVCLGINLADAHSIKQACSVQVSAIHPLAESKSPMQAPLQCGVPRSPGAEVWVVSHQGCVHRRAAASSTGELACGRVLKHGTELQTGDATTGFSFCSPVCFSCRWPKTPPSAP